MRPWMAQAPTPTPTSMMAQSSMMAQCRTALRWMQTNLMVAARLPEVASPTRTASWPTTLQSAVRTHAAPRRITLSSSHPIRAFPRQEATFRASACPTAVVSAPDHLFHARMPRTWSAPRAASARRRASNKPIATSQYQHWSKSCASSDAGETGVHKSLTVPFRHEVSHRGLRGQCSG